MQSVTILVCSLFLFNYFELYDQWKKWSGYKKRVSGLSTILVLNIFRYDKYLAP
jgi:hypothetical protein